MIHSSSKDPIYIKKIYLKIWTLRSEVEQVVKKVNAENKEEIASIKEEYSFKGPLKKESGLQLLDGGAEDQKSAETQDEKSDEINNDMEAQEANGDEEANAQKAEDDNEEIDSDSDTPSSLPIDNGPKQIIQRGSQYIEEHNIHHGVCVLSEVTMDTFSFFTSKNLLEGQSIVIEFQVPKKFVVNAEVRYCRPFNIKSRIISENRMKCRVTASFSFLKEGERTLLRQFIQSIEPHIPETIEIPKAQTASDDSDDFDDLDGLDF